jgi:preprotein translocase subunit SecD
MDREKITEHFNCILNLIQENSSSGANAHIDKIFTILTPLQETIREMSSDISHLKDEFTNYQKVSLVKNLNTQLHEKNIEITHLSKKLNKMTKQIEDDFNAETDVDAEVEVDAALVEAVEVVEVVAEVVADEVVEVVADVVEVVAEVVADEVVEVDADEVVEVDVEVDAEVEAEAEVEDDEESVSLIEKTLKPKDGGKRRKFFITDDEDKDIYDILENGDPSDEPIGKLVGKSNKPQFF